MNELQASNLGRDGRDLPGTLGVCGYSPRPGDPTVPLCNRPAAAHITPLDRGERASWTVYACAEHAPLALPQAWDAHPLTEACLHPRSLWVKGTAFRVSGCAMPREQAGAFR